MSDYVKQATEAGDKYLAALAEGQKQFLKAMEPMSSMTASAPTMSMPSYLPDLPTPHEMLEANYAFAKKFLKQQKDFTDKLFAATTPAS